MEICLKLRLNQKCSNKLSYYLFKSDYLLSQQLKLECFANICTSRCFKSWKLLGFLHRLRAHFKVNVNSLIILEFATSLAGEPESAINQPVERSPAPFSTWPSAPFVRYMSLNWISAHLITEGCILNLGQGHISYPFI